MAGTILPPAAFLVLAVRHNEEANAAGSDDFSDGPQSPPRRDSTGRL
jgi:hypothetical protein